MKGRIVYYEAPKNRVILELDGDFGAVYDRLNGQDVDVQFKKWAPKRSGAANRYMWVLIDRIAAATHQDRLDVYKAAIVDIGGVSDVLTMKNVAVKRFCDQWQKNGLGWQTEVIEGNEESTVIAYYGSSTFNRVQFTELIDKLIFEAEQLGIDTDTPDKKLWWESLEE